mmetsp:Transcript_2209/g.5146  ORF Transcript_2209/g.5146 Transcript_2209/m.5146 type:complete len:325 (-) Transcript_2209:137-1111(-)
MPSYRVKSFHPESIPTTLHRMEDQQPWFAQYEALNNRTEKQNQEQTHVSVYPRRKAGQPKMGSDRPAVLVTREFLGQNFHLPLSVVAKKLNLSGTVTKNLCRKLGIEKWPYKRVRTASDRANSAKHEGEISEASTASPLPNRQPFPWPDNHPHTETSSGHLGSPAEVPASSVPPLFHSPAHRTNARECAPAERLPQTHRASHSAELSSVYPLHFLSPDPGALFAAQHPHAASAGHYYPGAQARAPLQPHALPHSAAASSSSSSSSPLVPSWHRARHNLLRPSDSSGRLHPAPPQRNAEAEQEEGFSCDALRLAARIGASRRCAP